MSVPCPITTETSRTHLTWLAFLVFVLGVGCSGTATKTGHSSAFGKTVLTSLEGGQSQSLSDFRGKPLIVNLWAPWCAPCVREMPEFDKVHRELGDRVSIVGVTDSLDRTGSKRLAASTGVTYPLLVDGGGNLQVDLGVVNLPTTVFFDAEGNVLRRHAGALTADRLSHTIEALYDID